MGAQADSARLELLASSHSRPTCCRREWAVFFPFFPFVGCDSLGMSVGSDRTLVSGLDQGDPSLRLCYHWLWNGGQGVSLVTLLQTEMA